MSERILLLDEPDIAELSSMVLKVDIDDTLDLDTARSLYDQKSESYIAMIVEPFITPLKKIQSLRDFMYKVKTESGLYVIAYSTQEKYSLKNDFGIESGIHYDRYIGKIEDHSIRNIKETLNSLVTH